MEYHSWEDLSDDEKLLEAEQAEISQAKALIVRHAHSQGNAGFVSETPGEILLTESGHRQADYLAKFLPHNPQTIIHSPYVRTRLTADPTIKLFPNVKVLEWPIQEFTYINPAKYPDMTVAQRKEAGENYWNNADPDYCDGGGAESFADLWKRVIDFRQALEKVIPGTVIFSHGQFIRALVLQLQSEKVEVDSEIMKDFRRMHYSYRIPNTARLVMKSSIEISRVKVSHLPRELITY